MVSCTLVGNISDVPNTGELQLQLTDSDTLFITSIHLLSNEQVRPPTDENQEWESKQHKQAILYICKTGTFLERLAKYV